MFPNPEVWGLLPVMSWVGCHEGQERVNPNTGGVVDIIFEAAMVQFFSLLGGYFPTVMMQHHSTRETVDVLRWMHHC